MEQESEDVPNKNWFAYAFSTRGTQGAMNGMSTEDFLWAMQNKVIHQLARRLLPRIRTCRSGNKGSTDCPFVWGIGKESGKTIGRKGSKTAPLLPPLYGPGVGNVTELPSIPGQRSDWCGTLCGLDRPAGSCLVSGKTRLRNRGLFDLPSRSKTTKTPKTRSSGPRSGRLFV